MMRGKSRTQIRVAPDCEQGQGIALVLLMMMAMLGIAGLSVDVGRAYVLRQALQNEANAGALAAAGQVYYSSSTSQAQALATAYGGGTYNAVPNANAPVITPYCLNALMPTGQTCTSTSQSNAIRLTESANMNTLFMRIFGMRTMNVHATAMASMQGSAQPWNVVIILDATGSMSNAPASGSCSGYSTKFACALHGVTTLLQRVNPCNGASTCTTGSSGNSNFRVALFSFPNVSSSTVSKFYTTCAAPTSIPYTFPATNLTSYSQDAATNGPYYAGNNASSPNERVPATYEDSPINSSNGAADGDANGFVVNYWLGSSSSPAYLNSSSSIVKEVAISTPCLTNPGGQGTYYAGVIYAAQAALTAEHALYPKAKNAIVILSDGQAQAVYNGTTPSNSNLGVGAPTQTSGGAPASDYLQYIASPTSTNYYPSATDECQQAIKAAQVAQAAGTKIYSVAFGSTSSGCTTSSGGTDSALWASATSGQPAFTALSQITPCAVMKNIASPTANNIDYFYADSVSTGNSCTSTANSVSNVGDIFSSIAATFTSPRLMPPGSSGNSVPSF